MSEDIPSELVTCFCCDVEIGRAAEFVHTGLPLALSYDYEIRLHMCLFLDLWLCVLLLCTVHNPSSADRWSHPATL